MKRLIFLVSIGFTLGAPVFADDHSVLARITVYWRSEGQLRASWNGARLRDGHCAVDPKKIPYGSKVLFADATCLAVDTGPAVVSRKAARSLGRTAAERNAIVIDRFFENKQQAVAWARTHPHFMTVQIQTAESESKPNSARIAAKDSSSGGSVRNDTNAGTVASRDTYGKTLEPGRVVLLSASFLRCARRRT
jgi:3D (Asp-Asp-Asp) domain-containing protein